MATQCKSKKLGEYGRFSFFACPVAEDYSQIGWAWFARVNLNRKIFFLQVHDNPAGTLSIQLAAPQGRCQTSWQSHWDATSPPL